MVALNVIQNELPVHRGKIERMLLQDRLSARDATSDHSLVSRYDNIILLAN